MKLRTSERTETEVLRQVYRDWLEGIPFDVVMTVNPNADLSWHRHDTIMRTVDACLNRRYLGPRFAKRPEHHRVAIVGVPERGRAHWHFHFAAKLPSADSTDRKVDAVSLSLTRLFREERQGRRFLPSASIDVQAYRPGWISYILKSCKPETPVYVRGLAVRMEQT